MATSTTAQNYFYAIARRKRATARVRLKGGKGSITVNDKPAADYFSTSAYLLHSLDRPFATIGDNKFDVSVHVSGGGLSGQADAITLGIAKSLVLLNPDLKSTLKRADLLGRDTREKERKKFGFKKARKVRQFTKR
jgi:small subunit ribosomal protein S9